MTRARDLASGQNGIRPFAIASGGLSGGNVSATITYPSGRFTQTPKLAIMASSVSALANPVVAYWSANSTTSFTAQIRTSNDSANIGYFDWIAIQMTSGSASG
jgi:hypothetical protein